MWTLSARPGLPRTAALLGALALATTAVAACSDTGGGHDDPAATDEASVFDIETQAWDATISVANLDELDLTLGDAGYTDDAGLMIRLGTTLDVAAFSAAAADCEDWRQCLVDEAEGSEEAVDVTTGIDTDAHGNDYIWAEAGVQGQAMYTVIKQIGDSYVTCEVYAGDEVPELARELCLSMHDLVLAE